MTMAHLLSASNQAATGGVSGGAVNMYGYGTSSSYTGSHLQTIHRESHTHTSTKTTSGHHNSIPVSSIVVTKKTPKSAVGAEITSKGLPNVRAPSAGVLGNSVSSAMPDEIQESRFLQQWTSSAHLLKRFVQSRWSSTRVYEPPEPPAHLASLITKRGMYPCVYCNDAFTLESSLCDHLTRVSTHIKFRCDACRTAYVFYNRCALKKHLATHQISVNRLELKDIIVSSVPGDMLVTPVEAPLKKDPVTPAMLGFLPDTLPADVPPTTEVKSTSSSVSKATVISTQPVLAPQPNKVISPPVVTTQSAASTSATPLNKPVVQHVQNHVSSIASVSTFSISQPAPAPPATVAALQPPPLPLSPQEQHKPVAISTNSTNSHPLPQPPMPAMPMPPHPMPLPPGMPPLPPGAMFPPYFPMRPPPPGHMFRLPPRPITAMNLAPMPTAATNYPMVSHAMPLAAQPPRTLAPTQNLIKPLMSENHMPAVPQSLEKQHVTLQPAVTSAPSAVSTGGDTPTKSSQHVNPQPTPTATSNTQEAQASVQGMMLQKVTAGPKVRSILKSSPACQDADRLLQQSAIQSAANDEKALSSDEHCLVSCTLCREKFPSHKQLQVHFSGNTNVQSKLQCPECQAYLPSPCALKAHVALHSPERSSGSEDLMVCPECGVSVNRANKHVFAKHIQRMCLHKARYVIFTCLKCTQVSYERSADIVKHVLTTHTDTLTKCTVCPKVFRHAIECDKHINIVHQQGAPLCNENKVNKCGLCDALVNTEAQLETHVLKHVEQSFAVFRFRCYKCRKGQALKSLLKRHLSSEHQIPPIWLMCSVCGAEFNKASDLREHSGTCKAKHHHSSKSSRSSRSSSSHGSSSSSKSSSSKHVSSQPKNSVSPTSSKHGEKGIPKFEPTSDAGDVLKNGKTASPTDTPEAKEAFDAHADANADPPSYPATCPVCSKSFRSSAALKSHIVNHKSNNKFVCTKCLIRVFDKRSKMQGHLRHCTAKDSGEATPAKRKAVEKAADRPKIDIDSESDEEGSSSRAVAKKPAPPKHECPHCDGQYNTPADLREHVKNAHKSMPLFPCQLCGMLYYSKAKLDEHLKETHGTRAVACTCWLCPEDERKPFPRRQLLERHIISAHKVPKGEIDWSNLPGSSASPQASPSLSSSSRGSSVEAAPPEKRLRVDGGGDGSAAYHCGRCDFTTQTTVEFHEHIRHHKLDEDSLQCLECGLCFVVEETLKRHLFMVHRIRDMSRYKLKPKPAATVTKTASAINVITEDASAPIPVATKELSVDVVAEPVPNALECHVCFKVFDSELLLKTHMRTHGMAFIRSRRIPPTSTSSSSTPSSSADTSQPSSVSVSGSSPSQQTSVTKKDSFTDLRIVCD